MMSSAFHYKIQETIDGVLVNFCLGDTEFSVQYLGPHTCGQNDFNRQKNPRPIKLG